MTFTKLHKHGICNKVSVTYKGMEAMKLVFTMTKAVLIKYAHVAFLLKPIASLGSAECD